MCGIAGYRGRPDRLAEQRVRLMTDALAHRGPDGDGFFSEDGVVLGHRRLKILDLSEAARQPISDSDGLVVVSFNGEIYNYRELRAELESRGHRFSSTGDAAVIPAAYLEWGLDFARHLRGMFALALYDRRDGRMVLLRDRIGIKPLYVARLPEGIVFASEMRAIVAAGFLPRSANADALRQFLRFGYRSSYATAYQGIDEVAPGSLLISERSGALEVRRFWSPPATTAHDPAACPQRVREILERAVDRHLQSDVPVGAHLSGGVDSSTIVSLMAQRTAQPIQTFSVFFEDSAWFDERQYSTAVSAASHAVQHFVSPTPGKVRDELERIIDFLDEPVGGPGAIPQYFLNEEIRNAGIRVVLGGQGADEMFAGYERYRLPHALTAARTGDFGEAFVSLRRTGLRNLAVQLVKRVLRIDPAAMLTQGAPPDSDTLSLDFARQLAHEFRWYLPMLLHVEDRTSMAWSIESRVPFIDDELVEYVLSVPAELKIYEGRLKWMLRDAVRGTVPDLVLDRTDKRGLPTPLGVWMRGPLRSFAADVLTDPLLRRSGLVDMQRLERIFNAHLAGVRDFGDLLWRPLAVAIWLARSQAAAQRPETSLALAG
ncbi:MAG: asparagine synthase (glutamine-hydrolyzing) [Vulcanimicrobiaceae bacterium]